MWVNFYIEGPGARSLIIIREWASSIKLADVWNERALKLRFSREEAAGKPRPWESTWGRASWLDDPPSHFRCSEQLLDLILLETLKSMQFTLSSRNTRGKKHFPFQPEVLKSLHTIRPTVIVKQWKITWHCCMNATVVSLHALSISLHNVSEEVLWPWPHLILKQSWLNVLIHISQRHMQTFFSLITN